MYSPARASISLLTLHSEIRRVIKDTRKDKHPFLQIPPQITGRKFVLRYLAPLFIPGGTLEFYCKGCEMDMQCDKMFQCVTCKNYCLCKTCERQGTHPQHNMLCIRNNASDTVCKTNIYERIFFFYPLASGKKSSLSYNMC